MDCNANAIGAPMMVRCINNRSAITSLTLGKAYEVVFVRDGFTRVIDNNGKQRAFYTKRFEPIEGIYCECEQCK